MLIEYVFFEGGGPFHSHHVVNLRGARGKNMKQRAQFDQKWMVSWFINELLYITIVISSYIQKHSKTTIFGVIHNLTNLAIVNGGPPKVGPRSRRPLESPRLEGEHRRGQVVPFVEPHGLGGQDGTRWDGLGDMGKLGKHGKTPKEFKG